MTIVDFFDQAAGEYDNVGVDFFTPMGAALVAAAAPAPGSRVLDVGCGRGAVLFPAADAVGPSGSVTGIDLAPGMVSRTAAAASALPSVEVRLGDAQSPDFPPASFDLITAGLVVFFLPSPRTALRAYFDLLRPGGRLAFSCFAAHDPGYPKAMTILARHAPSAPPVRAIDDMFKTEASITAASRAAGFTRTDVHEVPIDSHFRDAAHLVEWIGSHAGRQVVGRIPQETLPSAIAAVAAELPGPITFQTQLRVVVAHR